MTVTVNGSTGVSLADTNAVPTAAIQANAVTQAKLATGVAGTGPAFRAYPTGGQSCANLTWTKVQLNNETFDTASCFDSSTNYRFTPTVAGYYQVNAVCAFNGSVSGYVANAIYKNGTNFSEGCSTPNNGTFGGGATVCDVLYLNGSTDYIEMYVCQSSGGALTLQATSFSNFFSASLVRAT